MRWPGASGHTLLRPEASRGHERLCAEAASTGFHWCVSRRCGSPRRTPAAPARASAACRLPLRLDARTKADEAAAAIESGAREVDLVMQIGWLCEAVPRGGQQPLDEEGLGDIAREIRLVRAAMRAALARTPPEQRLLKVIIETGLLDERQKTVAAHVAAEAGADYVKTCTGSLGGGATVADVSLLRAALGGRARIKAAGGIRDRAAALALIEAGADRLGCSASVAIVRSGA
jgi:deoxyribose-phosphate aldolase